MLRAKLRKRIPLQFEECTLDDVLKRLCHELDITIEHSADVSGGDPVSLDIGAVNGLQAIRLLADVCDLDWMELNGTILLVPGTKE